MPMFAYEGLNTSGRNVRGNVEAESSKAARMKLKRDGVFVTKLTDKKAAQSKQSAASKMIGGRVNVQDLAMMTRQLATLIKANIPIVDALTAVTDQVENPVLKAAMSDIRQQVNEGSSLYKALLRHPKIFTPIYISMAEAGEMSGTLDIILLRLAEFTEAANKLNNKVRSAMMYPVLMAVFGFSTIMVMFIFIVPQITSVFEDIGKKLPWYTELLISMSNVLRDYWLALIIGIVSVLFLFIQWKNSPTGRPQWDSIKLRSPIFGKLVRMVAISRFARTLSTLLTGGVPMLTAFDIVRRVVDNKILEKVIQEARDNVSEGESIAAPLKRSGQFPPIVIHMISVGEKTGELENLLSQVSDTYDFQVATSIEGLTSLLTPIMLLGMGGVVGFIVFSIMVPLSELAGSVQ